MSAQPKVETVSFQDIVHILQNVGLFSGIKTNESALKFICDLMRVENYERGHVLTQEGELGDEFFVLVRGQVSVYKMTPEKDVYKVAILTGEKHPAFGEGGLVDREPRSATVKCDKDCLCLVLTNANFERFCNEHPDWAMPIFKNISRTLMARLNRTNTDLMLLHSALTSEIRGN